MSKSKIIATVVSCIIFMVAACDKGTSPKKERADVPAAAPPASVPVESKAEPASAPSRFSKISNISDAWSALFKQNEKVINKYEGMPILELVTPALAFVSGVQYDMLNLHNRDGRFEGKLVIGGYNGFAEKTGATIAFGSERTLEKNGFGPTAKAGDRMVENGFVDLDKEFYRLEKYTERGGKKISRNYTEFKRLGDGSMICLAYNGHTINLRGDNELGDEVIYLHNGKDQYDFVIGKAKRGPDFKALSFVDRGDLTKTQAIELFKTAGYTLDEVGGITDGKLVLDK